MDFYDTVPREADAKQDAFEEPEPGVAERTDGEEDAPEELLSVPAKMRDRGVMKESYCDHLHVHVITTAGMPAVLGLVHTIFTVGKKIATLLGTRIWNISIVPKYPKLSSN